MTPLEKNRVHMKATFNQPCVSLVAFNQQQDFTSTAEPAQQCPTGYNLRPADQCVIPETNDTLVFEERCNAPYQQCAGDGFEGPFCCTAGYECTVPGGNVLKFQGDTQLEDIASPICQPALDTTTTAVADLAACPSTTAFGLICCPWNQQDNCGRCICANMQTGQETDANGRKLNTRRQCLADPNSNSGPGEANLLSRQQDQALERTCTDRGSSHESMDG